MAEQNNSGAAVVGAEIKILNPDSDVILGVEAKVVINTEKVENAVLVPITAVNVDMDGEFVYVVENNILGATFASIASKSAWSKVTVVSFLVLST